MPKIKSSPQLRLQEETLAADGLLPLLTAWEARQADAAEGKRWIKLANAAKKALIDMLPVADSKDHLYRVGVYTINVKHVNEQSIAFERGESRRITIHSDE